MSHPKYSREEIIKLGATLYNDRIRSCTTPADEGKFLAIDIVSGVAEIEPSELTALKQIRNKNPEAIVYLLRIGDSCAYKLGGHRPLLKSS